MNAKEYIEQVTQYSLELEELVKGMSFPPEDRAYQEMLGQYEKIKEMGARSNDQGLRQQIEEFGHKLQAHTQLRRGARRVQSGERRVIQTQLGNERVERRQASRNATTDPITGLPNVAGLRANQSKRRDAVYIAVDLTHFKHVNEAMGHLSGNEALKSLANVMRQSVELAGLNPKDVDIHRSGGDEFVIMVRSPHHAARFARAFRTGLDNLTYSHAAPQPGQEANAAGDAIQASATMGIGRNYHEADVAAAVAKNRKNEKVRNHIASFPPDQQQFARQQVLQTGRIDGESLVEVHSLLPGLQGPLQDTDSRWMAPQARRPVSSTSVVEAKLEPVAMPPPVDAGVRDPIPASQPAPKTNPQPAP